MSHAQRIFVSSRFDPSGSAPLYARLKNLVQRSIESGELKEGDADWLSRSSALPTPDETLKFSISPSERVSRFHRLRCASGIPLAIENAVVTNKFLPDPELVEGSLYSALDARGLKPVRALQRLHASALSAIDAKLLDLPIESPALFIERISYLSDGRAVEFSRSCYWGDSYDVVAKLTIAPEAKP